MATYALRWSVQVHKIDTLKTNKCVADVILIMHFSPLLHKTSSKNVKNVKNPTIPEC